MKSKFFLGLFGACLAGVLGGYLVCASVPCRDAIGRLIGRGGLIALINGEGVYEQDLARRIQEWHYRNDDDENAPVSDEAQKSALIADVVAGSRARHEKISGTMIDHEYEVSKSQLGGAWTGALRANRLCSWMFRRTISDNLRTGRWIERELKTEIAVGDEECREYFDANPSAFSQPVRFRAAHLFLAAPPETARETVDIKRQTIEELSARVKHGEKLVDLVCQFSEDEATKKDGGDLKYFSELRMPDDFMAAIRRLRVDEISDVVETKLGFHIIHLTDLKAARPMTFDEARPEIVARLENAKRGSVVQRMMVDLAQQANFSP